MKVVGIISFPRSGNRWMRNIVAAAMGGTMKDVPDLHQVSFSSATCFNDVKAFKFHAGTMNARYKDMDADVTHVVHIRRNPLDVFVSYVNYKSNQVAGNAIIPFDSIEKIKGTALFDIYLDSFILHGHIESPAFYQLSKSYFEHNSYWLEESTRNPNVHCVRYEDVMADPIGALSFLPEILNVDMSSVEAALEAAEKRTQIDGRIVWRKKSNGYTDYLSDHQVKRFLDYRVKESAALGYFFT